MILFFSGTGNSKYAAKMIAAITSDTVLSINDRLKRGDTQNIDVAGNLVIVTPTYAWRIPRLVERWLNETKLQNIKGVWFVMTCGSEIGDAAAYNRALCDRKRLHYMGTFQICMPENYIALFRAPDECEAKQIITRASMRIDSAGMLIKNGCEFPPQRRNICEKLMSSTINPLFYRFFIKAGAFFASDACVSCGNCVQRCPLNNIRLVGGHPQWGNHCTHCMACICRCPKGAIEFGKKSIGKRRYYLDEN